MEILVRYRNGTLYSKSKQEFITLEDVTKKEPGTYSVVESSTKDDITAEVCFLADVDLVRREGLWKKAFVALEPGARKR